ncbi:hypothetical protein JOC74_004078 [Bacillus capparidis]|uniref:Uncharacterized protein n=1 Tax=Bacillus capparidis TaxID=1840411 RepID=A0ABS4D1P1_9BACI|nr:hypothetical protein [Bacillus capparidis]
MNEMSLTDYLIEILKVKKPIVSAEEEPSFTYFNGEEK